MARYADIVAAENKSLSQQVGVLNEMLDQKERDNAKLRAEFVDLEMKLGAKHTEMLGFEDLKQALEREKRLHHSDVLSLDRLREKFEAFQAETRETLESKL
jgi:Rad3-related DNA helicase